MSCRAQSARNEASSLGDLQHRRAKRTQKAVGIAWAKSGARPAGDDDDGLMPIAPPRVSQRTGLLSVRRNFNKPDRRIAIEASETALDACRTREATVKQRQSLDPAAVRRERCLNRVDPIERKFLARRFSADLAHLVREPVAGQAVNLGTGAMESLVFVSADNRADALPHGIIPL